MEGRRKNVFACLYSIHNTISLSRHEQVCLSGQKFGMHHEFACHPCAGAMLRVCYSNTYIKIGTIHSRLAWPCARLTRKFVNHSKFLPT